MNAYYDYEVEEAYMPSDEDMREWVEYLKANEGASK